MNITELNEPTIKDLIAIELKQDLDATEDDDYFALYHDDININEYQFQAFDSDEYTYHF